MFSLSRHPALATAGVGRLATAGRCRLATAGCCLPTTAGRGPIATVGLGLLATAGVGLLVTVGLGLLATVGLGLLATAGFAAQSSRDAPSAVAEARVTLDAKDADLRDVLRHLAAVGGVNLYLDPEVPVGRTVTVKLDAVPWRTALSGILRVHGLAAEIEGNVARVGAAGRHADQARQAADLAALRGDGPILQALAIPLSHANVAEAERIVRGWLSPAGSVTGDSRTNTLVVRDVPSVIAELGVRWRHATFAADAGAPMAWLHLALLPAGWRPSGRLVATGFVARQPARAFAVDASFVDPGSARPAGVLGVPLPSGQHVRIALGDHGAPVAADLVLARQADGGASVLTFRVLPPGTSAGATGRATIAGFVPDGQPLLLVLGEAPEAWFVLVTGT